MTLRLALTKDLRALDRLAQHGLRPLQLSGLEQSEPQVRGELEPRPLIRGREGAGALEQVDHRSVSPRRNARPCRRGQRAARPVGQPERLLVHSVQLGAIPVGLLEVVAEELLRLSVAPSVTSSSHPAKPLV